MIGQTLSHYKIVAKLGAGGMGEVYRAEDTDLGREVAIKLLPEEVASDPAWLERFEREAKAVASINHPNIITIYSIEQFEGTRFFSMELVEGKTLARSIPSTGLPLDSFWDIAIPLVDAIAASHEMGVTHRDLKPGNVMIGKNDRVKVLDFGIAKLEKQAALSFDSGDVTWAVTETGVIMGTMPYMSPEQVQGRSIDSRSDVFSLGVMLYEMITGGRPFSSETSADLISSILRDDPPPPSQRRTDLPLGLDSVVLKCLEKDPDNRYRSGGDLREDLENARKGQLPVDDATLAAAPSIAVLPFTDMSLERDQEYFCEGMADEIINAFTGIEGLRVASRTSSFRFRDTDADIQSIGKQLHVGTVLEGSVRKAGTKLRVTAQLTNINDGYHVWSRRFDRELEDVFAIQDEIAQNIVEALRVELSVREQRLFERSATSDVEAYDFFLRGRKFFYEGTGKGIELAREMFSRAARRDPNYALAYAGLANCHSYLFMYFDKTPANRAGAIEASRKAIDLGEGFADVHAARGLALSLDQQYDEAGRELEVALKLNPRLFEAHYFYGRVSREQGKLEKAAQLFEQASQVRPEDYQSLVFLAAAYSDLGRPSQADDARVRALNAIERHLESNPDDARALYMGGSMLIQLGDEERGLAWARRALDLDPYDPRVLYNLACIYCKADRKDEALDHFVRAVEAGYASREWIENDSDLDPIRDHPSFQAALAKLS
jgi:non-specific serine/threonine protein kinase